MANLFTSSGGTSSLFAAPPSSSSTIRSVTGPATAAPLQITAPAPVSFTKAAAPAPTTPAQPAAAPAGNPWNPSSYLQDYADSAQSRLAAPTAAQSYYAAYAPSNGLQSYVTNRQTTGYGPSTVADRYASQVGNQTPSTVAGQLGALTSWADSGSQATGRMAARSNLGPDALDSQYASSQQALSQPTATSDILAYLAGMAPAARGDALSGSLSSGASPTGQLQSQLSTNGPTAQFLSGFDPRQSLGLQDTYNKLAALGPTNAQTFYSSDLAGDNPAYKQLTSDFIHDTDRAAAARGGFVSGHALDLEQRGLSRLAADEYANRGALAAAADQSNQGQMGQLLSAANSLDSNYTSRQQLQAQTGLSLSNILSGLATSREGNLTSLATAGDKNALDLSGQRLQGAGQQDQALLGRQTLLGNEAQGLSNRDAARQTALDNLATSADSTDVARRQALLTAGTSVDRYNQQQNEDLNALAVSSDNSTMRRAEDLDALAGKSADDIYRQQQLGGTLASSADQSAAVRENERFNAATGASNEQTGNITNRFNEAMRLGDAQSGIQAATDAAAQGALTSSMIQQIQLLLAKSGIDAAQQQAIVNNLLSIGGLVGKVAATGK